MSKADRVAMEGSPGRWADLPYAAAEAGIRDVVRRTPLLRDLRLSERLGVDVWLKVESLQATGSFKLRGAATRLASLNVDERRRGVVTCSSGNHGKAVAYAARRFGVPATIYVPEWVDPVKLAGIEAAGARAELAGATFDETEAIAMRAAEVEGRVYVSAFDDPWVIAGQGTIAPEIAEQLGHSPVAVVAPLSGGGLIGGIAAWFRSRLPGEAPRIVAASAERAAVMLESLARGAPVQIPEEETLATALAGGIGPDNRYSFPLVQDLVDDHVSVTETDIADAIRYAASSLSLVLEGGGAVGLAALLSGVYTPDGGPIVVVLSGGNISAELLTRVLRGQTDP